MSTLFQIGCFSAFVQGIYDGDDCVADLAKHGDFGLGTFNGVDGEMLVLDEQCYRIDAQGVASIVPPETLTPFAQVCHFQKHPTLRLASVAHIDALDQLLDTKISTRNIFYMMRIDGVFEHIHFRSETCQAHPYRPLPASLQTSQREFDLNQVQGTLVVIRCPQYSSGLSIPGYHYHFIDADRKTGGHVFDIRFETAEVQINPIRDYVVHLPHTKAFDEIALKADVNKMMMRIV